MTKKVPNCLFVLLVLLSGTVFCGGSSEASAQHANYALVWSDEFSAPNGSPPDSSKWTFETGGGGWGNNELESYTNRAANASVDASIGDGVLAMRALSEPGFVGSDGIARNYTSARLKTQGLFQQTYGKFEARLKIPGGQGLWPAFWMLGSNIGT